MVESASDEFARITQARELLDVILYAPLELSVDARAPGKEPSTCCC